MKFILFLTILSFTSLLSANGDFYIQDFYYLQQLLGGKLSFPPQKLMDDLLKLDRSSEINVAIMPHGRSLERSVTSFIQPRTVFSWKSTNSSVPYYIFFGYTPSQNQLEVLSWNWKTKQFDFSLVKDYQANKAPQVLNANNFGCIACHQSRIPIFSESPWSESTFNGQVQSRLKREAQDVLAKEMVRNTPRRVHLTSPNFDLDVIDAGEMVQMQDFCRDACGGDLWCRRQIMETALHEVRQDGSSYKEFSQADLAKRVESFNKNWPKDSFRYANSEIPDRVIPLTNPFDVAFLEDPLRLRKRSTTITPKLATDYFFLRKYRLCYNFNSNEIRKIKSFNPGQIKKAMNTDQFNRLVESWPSKESQIVSTLDEAVRGPTTISGHIEVDWSPQIHPPRVVSDPNRPLRSGKELFTHYCIACHSGSKGSQPPGLPLRDPKQLRQYVGTAGRTVMEMISPVNPLMPPLGFKQPSQEEFQKMLNSLVYEADSE